MDDKKSYYKKGDFIGNYLKSQRIKAVKPFLKGILLDIACGDNNIVQRYGNGLGVDIMDFGADLIVDNYHNLPYADGSFDTIAILSSLNYFDEPVTVLKEAHRLLSNSGSLVITNTNATVMRIWHKFREPWAKKHGLSKKEVERLMESANFKLKESGHFNLGLSYIHIYQKEL